MSTSDRDMEKTRMDIKFDDDFFDTRVDVMVVGVDSVVFLDSIGTVG